ncbi:MAG: CoA-acylating methylmalonate-semialdehyde dehydrogenase [Pseudomonadota bacterium]
MTDPSALPRIGHFIDGQTITTGPRTAEVFDPAAGEARAHVCLADAHAVDQAVAAAERAFRTWRHEPPQRRARILFRFRQLLEQHANDIALAITREHGKVLDDAMGELTRGIEVVEYACGAPELLKGEHSKNAGPAIDCWSEHQPLGVVTGITPFNFPAMVPMWMFPIAIACGNTFVLKPSEKDPTPSLIIARLLREAGLPDGVFNVVNGDKLAVDALLHDPRIAAVSFVGSTPIAEYIYTTATQNGKRVQALGGAKNHAVVMPDADIPNAVSALMGAAFGSCGERCMAISVAVCVGDDTADRVVQGIRTALGDLNIGPGTDTSNDMGPLISRMHKDKVLAYIESGIINGASLVVDGRNATVEGYENGYFLGGCLFDHVTPDMTIYQEEIFGPVLCVVRVDSLERAMSMIDAHEYGNGTCLFTRDGEAARFFTDTIQVGMVGVNVPLPVPIASQSFGGWKRSLFGDLYAYGPDAVRFYTHRKTITQRWPSGGVRENASFAFPNANR